MSNLGFDATDFDPTKTNFEPLPAGDYTFVIDSTKRKLTKKEDGEYLEIGFKIPEGQPYAGRIIFDRFNLWTIEGNKYVWRTDTAGNIAKESFSTLLHAINLLTPRNHEELVGKKVGAKVVIKEDKTGQYQPSNEIKKYFAAASIATPSAVPMKKESAPDADSEDAPF